MNSRCLKKQEGSILIFTLIVLSVLFLGTLAMFRATESTTMVAGNISFKKAASLSGDIGVNFSMTSLVAIGDQETTIPNQYYAVQQSVDSNGLPTTVDWAQVSTQQVGNYNIQYVIERLCSGTLPISDLETECYQIQGTSTQSKKVGSSAFSSISMFFRVTVRVTGPKNTTSYIQAILQES